MMYYNFMETLKKNEYFLTRDLVCDIRKVPETAHYHDLTEDALYERIHQVLYHIYKRHASWLNNDASKNTLFTMYYTLGRTRAQEGVPLAEVIEVLLLIKKRVFKCATERMPMAQGHIEDQMETVFQNLSLFFDRMAEAVIAGYQGEKATTM